MTQSVADSKEQILDAVERLIIQKGYSRLSMRALAREAGLAKGTIYHHFEDKRHVCLRMIERDMNTTRDTIVSAAQEATGGEAKLRAVIETYFMLMRDRRHVIQAALREIGEKDPDARNLLKIHKQGLIAPIAEIIQAGIDEGTFRPVDVEMTVLSLLGLMNGFVTYRILLDNTPIEENVVEHTFELFTRGVLQNHGEVRNDPITS